MTNPAREPTGCPLTRRQLEIVAAVAGGATNSAVARDLGIRPRSVHNQLNAIYRRLGIATHNGSRADRGELVRRARPWLLAAFPTPDPDGPCSPAELAYAHAFVRLCRERTPHAAAIVTIAFGLMLADRGNTPPRERHVADIDEILLRIARGVMRPIPLAA